MAKSEKLQRGWDTVQSPKEKEAKDGIYKGGPGHDHSGGKTPKVD